MSINPIKARRFITGKTQDDIFIETGIFPSKLSRLERGYLNPSTLSQSEKKKLAHALNTTVEKLFGGL